MLVLSVFVFTITFSCHIKSLLIMSNFPKIDKAIVSNWYQNLDDNLINECVEIALQSLDSRLKDIIDLFSSKKTLKKSKKHVDMKRKNKKEME